MKVKTCPTCGSKRIERQTGDLNLTINGKTKTVRLVEMEICPKCGEKLFDHEAMRKIEAAFLPRPRKIKKQQTA
jgi:YgiT-type zinc finger domain-containing protein